MDAVAIKPRSSHTSLTYIVVTIALFINLLKERKICYFFCTVVVVDIWDMYIFPCHLLSHERSKKGRDKGNKIQIVASLN